MHRYIDQRLDAFFEKDSPHYHDYRNYYHVMWREIFDYIESIKNTMPNEFEYEVKRCRDLKNSMDTAIEEGTEEAREEGREEGERKKQIEIAKGMIIKKFDISIIMELTGLTRPEIEAIK